MYYIIALIIGFALGWIISSKRRNGNFFSEQSEQKVESIRKILELLNTKHPITNNDVESYLGVSDATATRYLDELEKEGKLVQVGKTGRHVYYERV